VSQPIPIIIDCDPGVDDIVALLLAFASPELDILGVTTVAGNVSAALTARNAAMVRQVARREAVPVVAGAARPLVRAPVEAGHFHGEHGTGALAPFEPAAPIESTPSEQAIVDIVMSRPAGSVTLVVTGPMTNVALAMQREPALAGRLRRIVAMGGARSEGGNITASAEFNIFADPHAAQQVFASGCPVVAFGLDATHQVRATEARIAAIEALGTPAAMMAAAMLRVSRGVERDLVGGDDAPLHDPCPIAWLLRPDLFELRPCRIEVETQSPLTLGHTAVEFRSDRPNARWAARADAQGVFDLLTGRLG
jgi:purine nucleosidase